MQMSERYLTVERRHTVVVEVLGTPKVVVSLRSRRVLSPGVLVDLEELARAVSSGGVLDLGHVCKNGTPVGTSDTLLGAVTGVVLVHLDRHCVTSREVALALSSSRVDIACGQH